MPGIAEYYLEIGVKLIQKRLDDLDKRIHELTTDYAKLRERLDDAEKVLAGDMTGEEYWRKYGEGGNNES